MGRVDDILREKQKLRPAESYVEPGQISTLEISDGTGAINTSDIADATITNTKIAAAAVDTTKGLTGGGGANLTVVPDTVFIELDGGVTPAKKIRVRAASITAPKLGAIAGGGFTGGAGVALALNPVAAATGGLRVTGGNKLEVQDAMVPHRALATINKLRRVSATFPACGAVAPVTVNVPILTVPAGKTYRLVQASIAFHTLVIDTDSLVAFNGILWRSPAAGGADENLMSGGTAIGLQVGQGRVAEIASPLSLSGTISDWVAGDMIYFQAIDVDTGGDNTINTQWQGGVITLELWETTASP